MPCGKRLAIPAFKGYIKRENGKFQFANEEKSPVKQISAGLIALLLVAVFALLWLPGDSAAQGEKETRRGKKEKLAAGDPAPDFALYDQNGALHKLSQYRGKKIVVLYFYPKDQTPGCTTEACSFRDNLSVFDSLETVVLGVSVDDTASHRKFAEKYHLNFPILSDADKAVSRAYHTLAWYGMSKRMTFVIDKSGVIRKIFPKVDVTRHTAEVADFIRTELLKK